QRQDAPVGGDPLQDGLDAGCLDGAQTRRPDRLYDRAERGGGKGPPEWEPRPQAVEGPPAVRIARILGEDREDQRRDGIPPGPAPRPAIGLLEDPIDPRRLAARTG